MSDDFAGLIDTANDFFRGLAANNNRDWYEPRKETYKTEIQKPAALLADLLAEDFGRLTGKVHKPKVFRIHRDVRFSKDKTPYNARMHMMWTQTETEDAPLWFFGSAPDYVILGMGAMCNSKASLVRYRALIDRDGDAVVAAMDAARAAVGAEIGTWGSEPLKRVPAPYDKDHAHGDLLRRKSLSLRAELGADWRAGLIPAVMTAAKGMMPLWEIFQEEIAA